MLTPEYKTALFRGVIAAFILAGVSFFQLAPIAGFVLASYSFGGVFFSTLAYRFLGEGTVDSRRANPPAP